MNLDGNGAQDFNSTNRRLKGDARAARRASIDKAALAIRKRDVDGVMPMTETRSLTKAERLARDHTGSEEQRRRTRGSVASAIAKVADVPSDTGFSDPHGRSVREVLRQRYPGRSLSSILERGEQLQAALNDDPVAAREDMLAAYSRGPVEGLPAYKAPSHAHGVRGSIQRARQDASDAADLKAAQAKHGKNLPNVLAQLEAMDRALHTNPALASARIAAAHGAPATESQIPAYHEAQTKKRAAKDYAAQVDALDRHIKEGIAGGHLPGDPATLAEMTAIVQHPRFEHTAGNYTQTLRNAAAIAQHPDYVWTTGGKRPGKKGTASRRDPGSLSLSGSSPSAGHSAPRGTGGVRASVDRAMAR